MADNADVALPNFFMHSMHLVYCGMQMSKLCHTLCKHETSVELWICQHQVSWLKCELVQLECISVLQQSSVKSTTYKGLNVSIKKETHS